MLEGFIEWAEAVVPTYGYFGAFFVSFVGSVIPFLPAPYLAVVLVLVQFSDPALLATASALGATLGKLSSYAIGRAAKKGLSRGRYGRKLTVLGQVISKYMFAAIFLAALTPLPDDVIFIPAGMVGYSLPKTFMAVFLGKEILTLVIAYGIKGASYFLGLGVEEALWFSIGSAAVFVILIALFFALNVEDWLEKHFLGAAE